MHYKASIKRGFKGYKQFMEILNSLDEPYKESIIKRQDTLIREAKRERGLKTARIVHGGIPLVFAYSDDEAGKFAAVKDHMLEIGNPPQFISPLTENKYYIFGKGTEGCLYYMTVRPDGILKVRECDKTQLPEDITDNFFYMTSPGYGRLEAVRVGHKSLHIRPDKDAEERPEELIIEI